MICKVKTLFEVILTISDILALITDVERAIFLCIHPNSADLGPENTKIEAYSSNLLIF